METILIYSYFLRTIFQDPGSWAGTGNRFPLFKGRALGWCVGA
jgi:hypothetical protein